MTSTLKDVAKRAGVSVTTVSRVINNYHSLSNKTIRKVRLAMRELDYQPNALARAMQGKSSHFIGLVLPNVTNPFLAELTNCLEERLFTKGYKVIIVTTATDDQLEQEHLGVLLANQVDGIISSSHNLDNEHYQRLAVPIVSFAHQLAEGIPVVTVDSYSGGRMAAAYLREQGAKEVALVLDEAHSPMSSRCRIDGIVDGLARRGNALAVIELDELIRKPLLLNQYDGLIAPNDEVAVQLQGMARASGRKINEDFWVTGYNGSRLMQRLNPELATVVLPVQELADKLIATLLEQLAHPDQVIESPAPVPVRFRRPT